MSSPRRAFTLLELIVAIGVILLLASLIIVSLHHVRGGADRALSGQALRQMAAAYDNYSTDNDGALMPGYADAAMLRQLGTAPKLKSGRFVDPDLAPASTTAPTDPNDASSYVWRLAPYLDGSWETMMTDYRSKELIARLTAEIAGDSRSPCDTETADVLGPGSAATAGCNDIGASRIPAYGLNSIYLGGDDVHGGDDVTDRNPWDNPGQKLAAVRQSEVRNPARIIVFAPTSYYHQDVDLPAPPVSNLVFGSCELRPPAVLIDGTAYDHWIVQANEVVVQDESYFMNGGGLPYSRSGGDQIPVAHLDGSVTTESIVELTRASDPYLKSWSPWAVGFP